MAKYKAKASYKELNNTKNFHAFGSASKHLWLMEGLEVEIKSVPKDLNDSNNFNFLLSASSHLKLIAGEEIEWNGKIPKKLADNLIEIKNTSKGGKE